MNRTKEFRIKINGLFDFHAGLCGLYEGQDVKPQAGFHLAFPASRKRGHKTIDN